MQSACFGVAGHEILETRFIYRYLAFFQLFNLVGIYINAGNINPHFRETGSTDKTHIAGAYNCDIHKSVRSVKLKIRYKISKKLRAAASR